MIRLLVAVSAAARLLIYKPRVLFSSSFSFPSALPRNIPDTERPLVDHCSYTLFRIMANDNLTAILYGINDIRLVSTLYKLYIVHLDTNVKFLKEHFHHMFSSSLSFYLQPSNVFARMKMNLSK